MELAVSQLPECPELERCEALLSDAVPVEQRARLEQHLEGCATCQARLDSLESGSALLDLVREVGDLDAAVTDLTLTHVLEQLHAAKAPDPGEPADLYFLTPSDQDGVLGTLGPYEVHEVIGQGGMGVVLKAFEPALHRLVAIKVMSSAVAGSATARRRFTREAQAAAAVCHENIVAVHAVHEIDGLPYLVMQYIDGESVQQRIERSGPLELMEIVRIGLQTAAGLAAAHAQGLIHRDIKPANLLLENGLARVKITDFGLARTADDVQLTQQGVVAGTPEYMAPEQARGESIDHRADLFSLGSVLYAMSTGEPPFQAGTAVAVLRKVSDLTPPPIRLKNPQAPPWLERLISRLLAKDPAERFQSAEGVAHLLEGYLAHLQQPTMTPAPQLPASHTPTEEMLGPPRRAAATPWWFWPGLLACSVLLIVGLGSAGWLLAAAVKENPSEVQHEYYHSFIGDTGNSQDLALFGPGADQSVKFEPEGLRVTVPATANKQKNGTGIRTGWVIGGDFEITVSFELLHEPVEAQSRLSLVVLWEKPPTNFNIATLSRNMGPEASIFATYRTLREQNADENNTRFDKFPTKAMKGQLRLVRTGTVLSYYAAEEGQPFRLLKQYPFAGDDLEDVRITGWASGGQDALDFRITDLRIWGDALRNLPTSGGRGGSWLAAGLGLLLALGACLAGWLLLRHRSRKSKELPARVPQAGEEPAPAAAAGSSAVSRPAWWPIAFCLPPLAFLAVLGVGLIVWGIAQRSAGESEQDFAYDFRGRPLPPEFSFYGEPEGKFVKTEPEGLRITIPNTFLHPWGGVGLLSRFGLHGDFEITTTLEILQADEPDDGFGVGAGLRLNLATEPEGVSLVRIRRPGVGQVIFWDRSIHQPEAQQPHFEAAMVPCTERIVRLRIKRAGALLSFLWAPGKEGATFQEIHQCPMQTEDIQNIRLTAMTGRRPYAVDVRFLELYGHSAGIAVAPFRWRMWIAAALLALILACGVSGLLLAGQRSKRKGVAASRKSRVSHANV
jgi:serine/threonine-protein kinase